MNDVEFTYDETVGTPSVDGIGVHRRMSCGAKLHQLRTNSISSTHDDLGADGEAVPQVPTEGNAMSHKITKVIEGLRYSTLTATEVCNFESSNGSGDFRYEDTSLYLSPRGRFFLAGRGVASRWARSSYGGYTGGEGVIPVSIAEARSFAEEHASAKPLRSSLKSRTRNMQRMRASKSQGRQRKIDAFLEQMSRHEVDTAAHILTCIARGSYFDADAIKETQPRALELAYLHLGDD